MTFTESHYPATASAPVLDLTAGDLLRHAAAEFPGRLALAEVAPPGASSLTGAESAERCWTYRALLADAQRCARWLLERFAPGERVTVWAPNVPEWVIMQYGAALAGLVLVTANPALRAGELGYVLRQSRSAGLAHTAAFRGTDMTAIAEQAGRDAPDLREVIDFTGWLGQVRAHDGDGELPRVSPGDPAQIQYTSGTTGAPKGALLHHRGLVTNASFMTTRLEFPRGGRWVSAMPLFHTSGCAMGVLGSALARGTYVLCQLFDPGLVLQALHDWRGDCVAGVPTMLIAMLEHPRFAEFDLGACGLAISGGTTVPAELVRRVEQAFGCAFSTVFGQTELSPVVTQTSPADTLADKAGTVGRPLDQAEVKVVDPGTGAVVPCGTQGEICARGYQVMLGYFDMPEATAAAIDADGWLHTGDLGVMDDRGYFQVTGRLKDMVIRGGENIYPREIEDLLFAHPAIADVTVVGVPDDTWGEQLAAVVRLADPGNVPAAAELRAYVRASLAPHKAPERWYRSDQFPLTGSGKVQKFVVRDLIAAGDLAPLD